jgi:hypothetical protein
MAIRFGTLLQAEAYLDGIMIRQRRRLHVCRQRTQFAHKDTVQVAAQRWKQVPGIGKRRFKTMLLHRAADYGTMGGTSGQRQPIARPVHVIRVEITADQLWPSVARCFIDHALKLFEALRSVDPCVQMGVPES